MIQWRATPIVLLLLASLTGCRLLFGEPAPPVPSPTGAASASPATVPEGLPDPIGGTAHDAGEAVSVDGLTVTYLGTSRAAGGLVSRFRVVGALPDDAVLLVPEGEPVELIQVGAEVTSDPWPPVDVSAGTELGLFIGNSLIPFRIGAIR